jgi:hypothetical protein
MVALIFLFLNLVASAFKPKSRLEAENVFARPSVAPSLTQSAHSVRQVLTAYSRVGLMLIEIGILRIELVVGGSGRAYQHLKTSAARYGGCLVKR